MHRINNTCYKIHDTLQWWLLQVCMWFCRCFSWLFFFKYFFLYERVLFLTSLTNIGSDTLSNSSLSKILSGTNVRTCFFERKKWQSLVQFMAHVTWASFVYDILSNLINILRCKSWVWGEAFSTIVPIFLRCGWVGHWTIFKSLLLDPVRA